MIDTNKVLIGLGQHISGRTLERCGCCPYFNGDAGYGVSCRDELLDDLYEMLEAQDEKCLKCGEATSNAIQALQAELKAQEPRVITAEQLEDWLEPVYLEDIFSGARWALIADFSANWFTFKVTEPGFLKEEEFHATEYGRRWRCWNKKPTKEQREAVTWDD